MTEPEIRQYGLWSSPITPKSLASGLAFSDVAWDESAADVKRPVSIRVVTDDRPGVLAKISATISEAGMNISQATCRTTGTERAVNTFEIATSDVRQLRSVMRNIEKLDGVVSVERLLAGAEHRQQPEA